MFYMKTFFTIVLGAFFMYFFSWIFVSKVGINNLSIQSEDTLPAMFLPFAIIRDHTLYLDNYYQQLIQRYPQPDDKNFVKGNVPFYLVRVFNTDKSSYHYLSAFPIITPLLVLPLYLIPVFAGLVASWDTVTFLAHAGASLIIAISGGVFYLFLYEKLKIHQIKSLILTAIYLFCSVNYAMISQSLWQHGTEQFLELVALYLLYDYLDSRHYVSLFFSGMFMGLAVLSRPTALLVWFAGYFIIVLRTFAKHGQLPIKSYIKPFILYTLGLIPCVLFFVYYNNTYYQNISNQGYSSQLVGSWLGNFPVSFLGVWFSPSKGILIYSPVFVFSLISLFIIIKDKIWYETDIIIYSSIVLLHTLIISLWKHWYGGWSFGYRMSSEIIPYLVLMLIPFVTSEYYLRYRKIFVLFISISFFIQVSGILFFDGVWHAAYDKGFHDTSWLWSVKDSEMAFNVRRVMVKVGVLPQACPKCVPR
jgi:hypothetical protein